MPRGSRPAFTSPTGSILQVKMRLIGVSPLRATFTRWYPGLAANDEDASTPAVAA